MARLNWTREAETWLRNIFEYIAQDNSAAAARVVEGIYERAQILSEFPQIGHRYEGVQRTSDSTGFSSIYMFHTCHSPLTPGVR